MLLTKFDTRYVSQKSVKGSIVTKHLSSFPISDSRTIDDNFPNENIFIVIGLSRWYLYFDGVANNFKYVIGVLLISPHGD